MRINSTIKLGAALREYNEKAIKSEPMFHRATVDFARSRGSVLTTEFLKALDWTDALIDSRVHMLMPGMYPCVPGWHHDDVPRERADGQPNYDAPSYQAEHCMALWGDCSLTEFALGEHEFVIPPLGCKIYKLLSPQVEALCDSGALTRFTAPERKLIYFDWLSWHRGAPTTKRGFRFFIRATRGSRLEPRNELRVNANVYMPVLDEGW